MDQPGTIDVTERSKVLTLVFTDLADSVGLKSRLGDSDAAQLIARHQAGLRETAAATNGREILMAGDGFFLTFEIPSDAVEFALRLIDFHRRHPAIPDVRIGIHMGEVTEKTQTGGGGQFVEVNGRAVDIGSRIQSLARPRQILMSYPVFDNARQRIDVSLLSLPVEWIAHGRYIFQGLDMALEVFEVGLKGISPFDPPSAGTKAQRDVHADEESTLGWRPAQGQDLPGRQNWVLLEKLGEGGFGDVWLTEHRKTHERHVIKFCYSPDRLRTLKREVTLFRLLKETLGDRPDIARVIDYQFETQPYFLEMEFAGRYNLSAWLDAQGGIKKIPLETRIELVAQVAAAIAAAHSVGVLHKDIKPSNIIVTDEGVEDPHIRMIDFGIGAVSDRNLLEVQGITATGLTENHASAQYASSMAGTRLYMAPEVVEGKLATTKSDIYALGVFLYQMAAGNLGQSLAFGWERDVPDELLQEDILACVDGHPENRLASAEVLAVRLRTLPSRHHKRELAFQDTQRNVRSRKRWQLIYLFIGLSVVLLIIFAQFAVLQLQKARAEERLRRRADAAALEAQKQTAVTHSALLQAQQAQYFGAIALAEASLREARFVKVRDVLLKEAPRDFLQREWGWLLAQVAPEDLSITNADIFDAAFTADGSKIVAGNRDVPGKGHLLLYDSNTGRRLSDVTTNQRLVWNIAISPDGKTAATASSDHQIAIVDITSPTVERHLVSNKDIVRDVAYSPDGKLFASVGRDHTLRLWRPLKAYKRGLVYDIPGENFTELAFSPDSKYIVTGSLEGNIRVFSTNTTQPVCQLIGSRERVLSVAFLADGKAVATASADGSTRIYSWPPPAGLTKLEPFRNILSHNTYPAQVISDVEGESVYIANDNGLITRFNVNTGEQLLSLQVDQPLWKINLRFDGKRLLAISRWSLRLLDLERLADKATVVDVAVGTTTPQKAIKIQTSAVSFRRDQTWKGDECWRTSSGLSLVSKGDGKEYVVQSAYHTVSPDGSRCINIDPQTLQARVGAADTTLTLVLAPDHKVDTAVFSPNGRQAALLVQGEGVVVYEAKSWDRLFLIGETGTYPVCITYTPDSKTLLIAYNDGRISAYNSRGTPSHQVRPKTNGVPLDLEVSDDGRLLAAGIDLDRAIIINMKTCDQISTMTGHARYIYDVKFAPEGDRLMTLSRDGTVKMWDVSSGRELVTMFDLQNGELPVGLAFGPDKYSISIATSKHRVVTTELFPWNLDEFTHGVTQFKVEDQLELWKRKMRLGPQVQMQDVLAAKK